MIQTIFKDDTSHKQVILSINKAQESIKKIQNHRPQHNLRFMRMSLRLEQKLENLTRRWEAIRPARELSREISR